MFKRPLDVSDWILLPCGIVDMDGGVRLHSSLEIGTQQQVRVDPELKETHLSRPQVILNPAPKLYVSSGHFLSRVNATQQQLPQRGVGYVGSSNIVGPGERDSFVEDMTCPPTPHTS